MLPGGLSPVKTGEGECTKGEQTASAQGVSIWDTVKLSRSELQRTSSLRNPLRAI